MDQYTREQLEELKMPQLVKLYNRLSKSKVKRFESRKVAVAKLLKVIAERAAVQATLPQGEVRTVNKMSAGKAGRPMLEFSVKANAEGKSEVRESSLRGQIMAHVKAQPESTSTITALEQKFGEKTRAAVQKLIEVDWLARLAAAV